MSSQVGRSCLEKPFKQQLKFSGESDQSEKGPNVQLPGELANSRLPPLYLLINVDFPDAETQKLDLSSEEVTFVAFGKHEDAI